MSDIKETKDLIEGQKELNQVVRELLEDMKEERKEWERLLKHFRDVVEHMPR
jgi:hypothetical protein